MLLARKQRKQNKNTCLLDLLIEKVNEDFTLDNVINEIVTLMLAVSTKFDSMPKKNTSNIISYKGQDAVATTLSFTLFFLAKHQEVQANVMEEIHSFENEPQQEYLNKTQYLDQVLKESMRLAPAVPVISRVLMEDVIVGEWLLDVSEMFLSEKRTRITN